MIISAAYPPMALRSLDANWNRALAGVPEYWIVDPRHRDVLIYSAPQDGRWTQQQRFGEDQELVSPTLPIRALVGQFFADALDTML